MAQNGKDPLQTVATLDRELFNRFSKAADGFSQEAAVGASINILLNALRQAYPTRRAAELALDEWLAKAKGLLDQHYDSLGRKRGVFPYHQNIEMPLIRFRNEFKKP